MNIEKSINISDNLIEGMLAGFEPAAAEAEQNTAETEQETGKCRTTDERWEMFRNRLRELIERTGKDAGAVCYEIGIGLTAWDEYLRGCSLPGMKTAKKIAEYFGVPVAVLLGDEELAEEEDLKAIDGRPLVIRSYSQEADDLIRKAEKMKITEFDVDKAICELAAEIAAKNAACARIPHGDEIARCNSGGLIALSALARFKPAKIGVSEPGRGKCPVCGEIVSENCPMCPHCLQRLEWVIDCGEEVYMSADPDCRFWICGRKENGFLYGYDMEFKMQSEHPDDLEPTGRYCPELARGLEAAARIEQQEGEMVQGFDDGFVKAKEKSKKAEGHWIICPDGYYPYCSECNSEPPGGAMSAFCPECGAAMTGPGTEKERRS